MQKIYKKNDDNKYMFRETNFEIQSNIVKEVEYIWLEDKIKTNSTKKDEKIVKSLDKDYEVR